MLTKCKGYFYFAPARAHGPHLLENGVVHIFLCDSGSGTARTSLSYSLLDLVLTLNWMPNWNGCVEVTKNGNLPMRIPAGTPVANATLTDTNPVIGASHGTENWVQLDGEYYINRYSDSPIDPATLNGSPADSYLHRVGGRTVEPRMMCRSTEVIGGFR